MVVDLCGIQGVLPFCNVCFVASSKDLLTLQIKLSIHLALGRVGLCPRSPKMGSPACICSGGFGERSPFVILGKN